MFEFGPMARSGSVTAIQGQVTTAPGTPNKNDVFSVLDGSTTLITCTVSNNATTCSNTASSGNTFAAGDFLTVKFTSQAGGSPAAPGATRITFTVN
jgi:hypothetical protein